MFKSNYVMKYLWWLSGWNWKRRDHSIDVLSLWRVDSDFGLRLNMCNSAFGVRYGSPKTKMLFRIQSIEEKKNKGLINLHILRFPPDLFRFCEPYCQNFRFL